MNTIFKIVYIITMPTYKDRIAFMKQQLDDLGIRYSFIFGTDFDNIKNDSLNNEIRYPQLSGDTYNICTGKDFSCAVSHYNAVFQAYEFGYDNVLIIEDDVCFIKNKNLLERYLTDIPKDADFVTYDPRFWFNEDFDKFANKLDNCTDMFIKDNNEYKLMFGGMAYGLMNRNTIKLYLENQRKGFCFADHVRGLFRDVSVNKYIASHCICTDEVNIMNNFKHEFREYKNNYYDKYKLKAEDFYVPQKYDIFERYVPYKNIDWNL